MSSTKFVFLGTSGKPRWPSWPLIGWEFFDFPSVIAEQSSTKLDRNQVFNVVYQLNVFGKSYYQDDQPGLWLAWGIFDFSSDTAEWKSTKYDEKQNLNVLYQVCVLVPIGKSRWPSWLLIGWDMFDFFSATAERNSMKLDKEQDPNVVYQVCVFQADPKTIPDSKWKLGQHWVLSFNFRWANVGWQMQNHRHFAHPKNVGPTCCTNFGPTCCINVGPTCWENVGSLLASGSC